MQSRTHIIDMRCGRDEVTGVGMGVDRIRFKSELLCNFQRTAAGGETRKMRRHLIS